MFLPFDTSKNISGSTSLIRLRHMLPTNISCIRININLMQTIEIAIFNFFLFRTDVNRSKKSRSAKKNSNQTHYTNTHQCCIWLDLVQTSNRLWLPFDRNVFFNSSSSPKQLNRDDLLRTKIFLNTFSQIYTKQNSHLCAATTLERNTNV